MAWNRLMLTAVGKTLYAKAQQGKPLVFTRVGIGDGNLGSGSLVNRTALISEKKSLLIDAIQIVNEVESAVITSLSNADLLSGFYFREIGVFARDPDTQAELLYLYDNAGADGEYIPDKQSGVSVSERLKFLLLLENVATVSFIGSGNPVYLTVESIDDTITGTGTLWSSSKVAAAAAAAEAAAKAASRPVTWTPSAGDVGAIPASQKGAASGVATLTSEGVLPVSQVPKEAKEIRVVANIAERNAISGKFSGLSVYVKDATGDSTVGSGGAYYLWDGAVWIKTGEAESMDVVLSWPNIQAKPASFAPSAHKSSHATGGTDAMTPGDIGAAAKSELTAILSASGTTAGTASALTLAQPGFVLADGAVVRVKLHVDSGATPTLNINGTGAKSIMNSHSKDIFFGRAGIWYDLVYSSMKNAFLSTTIRATDALVTKVGLDPATANLNDVISAAFDEVPIGDVRASIRDDFMAKIASGKYLPCDGRVVDATNYPALAQVASPIRGKLWAQNTVYGAVAASSAVVTDTGRVVVVSGNDSTAYKYSDDNGATWVSRTLPSGTYWIAKLKNNRLFTMNHYSDDNGITWSSHTYMTQILAITPTAVFAAWAGNAQSTIRKSTDNGSTWTSVDVGASQTWVNGCYTNSGRIIIGPQQSYFSVARYSDDGGTTWNALTTNVPSTAYLESLIVAPSGLLIASMSQSGVIGIWHSTNNGSTWTRVNTSINARNMLLVGSVLYAVVPGSVVWTIADYGAGAAVSSSGVLSDVSYYPNSICVLPNGDILVCKSSAGTPGTIGLWRALLSVTLPTVSNFYIKVAN